MAAAEGAWLEIVLPLDPPALRAALCATPRSFEGAWDGFRLLAFLCKQIFMLWYLLWHDFWSSEGDADTFFTVNILCTVLQEHCSCLSYFGGTLSQRCSLINMMKSESSDNCSQGVCPDPDQALQLVSSRDHQIRSRRVVREGGAQHRLVWGSVQWEQHFGKSRLFPPKKSRWCFKLSDWQVLGKVKKPWWKVCTLLFLPR